MIRRVEGTHWLLVKQVDHAALSGFLAGHIGNGNFARLQPAAITAIGAHDAGWALHDDCPTLNSAGLPLHVFETPPVLSTRIWNASVAAAETHGAYVALLVSIHQLALSDLTIRSHRGTRRDVFELNKFQHKQIEQQESLRKQLGMRIDTPLHLGLAKPGVSEQEDRLRFDFSMLTLCDRLSLELCCGARLFPVIERIIPAPGAGGLTIRTDMSTDLTLIVNPWPFGSDKLQAEIPARVIRAQPFADVEAFQVAYAAAPTQTVRMNLSH